MSADGVFHFGNLPRNAVIGPGFSTADLSIIKNTRLSAASRLQLRVEVFNLFNHANLGQPGRIATFREHRLRRHYQYAVPDRRLGFVAADTAGGEVSLLVVWLFRRCQPRKLESGSESARRVSSSRGQLATG